MARSFGFEMFVSENSDNRIGLLPPRKLPFQSNQGIHTLGMENSAGAEVSELPAKP